jgi:hypothetical protein
MIRPAAPIVIETLVCLDGPAEADRRLRFDGEARADRLENAGWVEPTPVLVSVNDDGWKEDDLAPTAALLVDLG